MFYFSEKYNLLEVKHFRNIDSDIPIHSFIIFKTFQTETTVDITFMQQSTKALNKPYIITF